MEYTYYSDHNPVRQRIQDALAAINSGNAKLEWKIVGGGSEDPGSWQNVLVSKDGTIFPGVQGQDMGNGKFRIQTSAPAEYGTNQNFTIDTSIDPSKGTLAPLKSQDQVSIVASPRGGGGFLDKVFDNTLGAVSDFIDGDPLKAAALFYGGAALAPELAGGATAGGATSGGATAGTVAGATEGTALSGIDLGGVGASPNTLAGAGAYEAAVPTAVAGSEFLPGAIGAGAGAGIGAAKGAAAGTALADILPYTAGAQVAGSLLQANAAKNAADQQTAAANAAIAQQQKNFETINAQQAPYRAAGYNALNQIGSLTSGQTPQYDANGNIVKDANGNPVMTTGSGYLQHQFDAADLAKGLAPNYDFMLQQGQMANQRAANMGGGALGGNALQGLNKFTQDYAGNAYQNAFTNYQNQRSNIYNTLAGIAGIGQAGQNATNTAATNATNATSQLGVGSAAAQAAGTTGAANAYGNALSNVTNQYTLASLLNQGGRVA